MLLFRHDKFYTMLSFGVIAREHSSSCFQGVARLPCQTRSGTKFSISRLKPWSSDRELCDLTVVKEEEKLKECVLTNDVSDILNV